VIPTNVAGLLIDWDKRLCERTILNKYKPLVQLKKHFFFVYIEHSDTNGIHLLSLDSLGLWRQAGRKFSHSLSPPVWPSEVFNLGQVGVANRQLLMLNSPPHLSPPLQIMLPDNLSGQIDLNYKTGAYHSCHWARGRVHPGTPWTGRQSITGPHRDKWDTQPCMLTPRDNLE